MKSRKAYIAIFVCLSTKAVHIELVGDLSSESFIAALKRFFARRGKARHIYSDNGTNVVGAQRKLNESFQQVVNTVDVKEYEASQGIRWHFIPPHAPHFGGIWEAAVKGLKYHMRRVIGESVLTYEEAYTFLTLIEACLNSRPLLPLSSDPNDFSFLTPGHFLTGDALNAIIEPDIRSLKEHALSRWKRIQKMQQHFWQRWRKEYLSSLQDRGRWRSSQPNLKIHQLVLIKEDNVPPLKWTLGRITETHCGQDGLVRVVSVRTTRGVLKRSISCICPLPEM